MSIKRRIISISYIQILILLLSLGAFAFLFGCADNVTYPDLQDEYVSVGKSRVYYTSNPSKDEVEALVKYLTEMEFFGTETMFMRLDKHDSNEYSIDICVPEFELENKVFAEFYLTTAKDISFNVFNDNIVTINLCDIDFVTIESYSSDEQHLDE